MQNYYCTQGKDRIFVGSALKLSEVSEQYGYKTAMSWLTAQIVDLNNQLGYKWKMDVQQVEDCCSLILERHGGLKVTELMFFFRGMKFGDYGEYYGTVNMNAIMTGLNKFYQVRAEQLSNIYEKEKEATRKENDRKRKETGLMAAAEYKNWLYDCWQREDGAEVIREYLIEHKVLVFDKDNPNGREPTLAECDPERLIAIAEKRERLMRGEKLETD